MKKIITLLLALVLTISLTACSNSGGTTTEDGKTRVVLWHTYTEDQQAFIDQAVADFNATHEDIEVVVETQALENFESKVMQAVSTGTGPNLIIHYASEAANYVNDGLVADLGKYVSED